HVVLAEHEAPVARAVLHAAQQNPAQAPRLVQLVHPLHRTPGQLLCNPCGAAALRNAGRRVRLGPGPARRAIHDADALHDWLLPRAASRRSMARSIICMRAWIAATSASSVALSPCPAPMARAITRAASWCALASPSNSRGARVRSP